MTALTWPIDWHAEVKDIVTREEDDQVLSKLVELQSAQVQYKASVLRVRAKEHRLVNRTVVSCVMKSLLLPALAKPRSERSEREVGVIGMCLHFFRNLLAIRDPVAHTLSSTALVANATLQSMLVEQLDASHVMDTLLMLASNADAKEYEAWAPVAADCIYQLYLGSDVKEIARVEHASVGAQSSALAASLDSEARRKRHTINNARHSRFGTTIQFTAHDGSVRVARQQPALVESISELEQSIADRSKRRVSRKRPATERGGVRRYTAWTPAGRAVLRRWADRFLQDGAFAVLEKQYLRDIHAERERIGDLDAARCKALQLATFFLEYFLARRADDASAWDFSMVAEWLEPWAFRLARARTAISLEAKEWLEFGAGVRLWTALLRLLDALAHGDEDQRQVADELQNTLYYDGDLLDTSLQVMHAYSAQSFACLETVLDFAYTMPRLLEKHASQREYMFVKQRRSKEEESTQQSERLFRFQTFQRAMATTRLAHVCTQYLGRWRDSAQPATMLTRLASVAHRIAVKATRPDLFFSAKARAVWVRLLRDPESEMAAVDAKAHTSLVQLATYLKRKFAKLDTSAQEAFDADKRPAREPKADKAPADIMVKPGLVHAEEIGVAVGLLGEQHKLAAVTWVKFHLEMASAARKALMASDPDADPAAPSAEVLDQFATHSTSRYSPSPHDRRRRNAGGRDAPPGRQAAPTPGRPRGGSRRRPPRMERAAHRDACRARPRRAHHRPVPRAAPADRGRAQRAGAAPARAAPARRRPGRHFPEKEAAGDQGKAPACAARAQVARERVYRRQRRGARICDGRCAAHELAQLVAAPRL